MPAKRVRAVSIEKDGKKVRVKVFAAGKGHLFTPAQARIAAKRFKMARKMRK